MEDNYFSKETKTRTVEEDGVITKTTETILSKNPNGTTRVITKVEVTQKDGSTSTQISEVTTAETYTYTWDPYKQPKAGGDLGPHKPIDLETFRKQALKAHNVKRSNHGVPDLKLSKDLNNYAQKWADHLVSTNTFKHSDCLLKDTRLGENMGNKWTSSGADYTGEEITDQWYSEIAKHDFTKDYQPGTGHFTQVVWKDTKEMGLGKAKDKTGKVIVIGNYRPAGNLVGGWSTNVFPPKQK